AGAGSGRGAGARLRFVRALARGIHRHGQGAGWRLRMGAAVVVAAGSQARQPMGIGPLPHACRRRSDPGARHVRAFLSHRFRRQGRDLCGHVHGRHPLEQCGPALRRGCQCGGRARLGREMDTTVSTPVLAARRSDIFHLYAARAARGLGDGFAFIILPAYLSELGFNPFQIGVVATAALLGTATTTLAVGFLAARYDLRNLLLIGAGVMALTGLAVANFHALAAIVIIVFLGSLNPSTGDLGMIVPLEHAMLARGAQDEERTKVFARYSLIGTASTAAGALGAAMPDFLVSLGTGRLAALEVMFYVYAALGVVGTLLYRRLPHVHPQPTTPGAAGLGPSRRTVYKLAALFSLDAFAGGFVVPSLLALWLFERFDLSLAVASVFFFWTNVLSALSFPVAARLARRFGLINTMVFTHIPS